METEIGGPLKMSVKIERWQNVVPFKIANHIFDAADVLLLCLEKDNEVGRGEAAGVFYRNDTPPQMLRQIEALRLSIESGVSRASVQTMLAAGGARNALDCAVWDLEAKLTGRAAWQIAGLEKPGPLLTTFTCGIDAPTEMANAARAYASARAIKVKLAGDDEDADRVHAVREARPDVRLCVDANQSLVRGTLDSLMPTFLQTQVELIEQPFPVGQESLLDGFQSPIPIAADESIQDLAGLHTLVGRFDMVNIKLDKCGGLSEGLRIARRARELGLASMVGNAGGTSLAMAPAFLVGQFCALVDLDGPVFLCSDREFRVRYTDGFISCPEALWGHSADGVRS